MPAQKLFPRRLPAPLRRRLDPVPRENLSDRAAGNLVTQIGQRPLDATIAPIPVLFGHSHYQVLGLPGGARPSRSALPTAVVLPGNQLSMPGQQRLGRDNRGHLGQNLPSQSFGLGRQATALVIVEPQPTAIELLAKHPVLLAKVVNDLLLALIHPPGNGDHHKPEGSRTLCVFKAHYPEYGATEGTIADSCRSS